MSEQEYPESVRDLLYAAEHGLADDDVGRAVVTAIQAGVGDEFTRDIIKDRVRRHRIASAFEGCFPAPRLHEGEIVAGLDAHGRQIRHPVQLLNAHCLSIGGSGSGKTTRSRFVTLQVARYVVGVWLIDARKREFAALRGCWRRMGLELHIVPARQLRLNPLQLPEGVVAEDWASRVADMLVQVLALPPRATKLLHAAITKLYRTGTPTLFDLRETIAGDTSLNAQAREAILDSLDPVLLSVGRVFKYRQGWSTSDLARRHIVFELGSVAEVDKDLILSSLILPEFTSRVARGVCNPRMNLYLVLDEAARLLRANGGGVVDLIGLIRGTGIALDLSVQSGDIAPAFLSNTATKYIGRCGSAADYDLIAGAMGLIAEQRRWMRLHLRPGMFIGQLGEGDWRHPFVCAIPPLRLDHEAQDPFLGDLDALPVEPATEFTCWDPEISSNVEPAGQPSDGLAEAEVRFLRSVIEHPGQPSSMYAKLARLSPTRATAIRNRLEELGYLRVHEVATGSRGRNAKVIEPLEPALRAVGRHP